MGQLLFYTNGISVFDRNNNMMPNGDSLAYDWAVDPDGYSVPQGIMILPWPHKPNKYIILHANWHPNFTLTFVSQLKFSAVDMNLNNGMGDIFQKNQLITKEKLDFGKITATRHANGIDWWALVPRYEGDGYYRMLIDSGGVHLVAPQFTAARTPWSLGQAVFSLDGTRYANMSFLGGPEARDTLVVYDFDRCTGILSHPRLHDRLDIAGSGGLAFSPSGRFLYWITSLEAWQYDLAASDDLAETEVRVATLDTVALPFQGTFFLAQNAPDGKIYVNTANALKYLHVINEPDSIGFKCQFCQRCLPLPHYNTYSLPNFPNYRLGASADSTCVVPLLADFEWVSDSAQPLMVRFRDESYFDPLYWHWDFGDGSTSTEARPRHTYATDGTYSVCLIVRNHSSSDTLCRQVTVEGISGVEELGFTSLQVGPNPFAQRLTLTLSTPLASPRVQVLDLMGRTLVDAPIELGINEFDTAHLPAGAYFWQVSTRTEGVVKSGKLVKM
jgi:hypothetical protein